MIKEDHELLKSSSSSSDEILFWDSDIAEGDFSSVRGTKTEFVFQLGGLKPFAICLDHDDTKSVMPRLRMRFGHAKNQKIIGKGPAGDERLGPIDDIFITIQNSSGSNGGNITSRIRLGDGSSGDGLRLHQGRHPFLLLLLCAKEENHFRAKSACQDKMGNPRINPPEFFVDETVLQDTLILLRHKFRV